MERRAFITSTAGLIVGTSGLVLAGCTTTPDAPADKAAKRREIDAAVDPALSRLYNTVKGRELGNRARGILVFPNVVAAGFIFGGEFGDGALRAGSRNAGYYRTITGSWGLQIGAQSKAVYFMFMTQDALDKFVASHGWTAGVDASVALAKVGANGDIDTNTAQQSVVGFVLTNAGLMANLTLEGTKITKLDL
jgi:lipid-binding SYLF domain-containing protein